MDATPKEAGWGRWLWLWWLRLLGFSRAESPRERDLEQEVAQLREQVADRDRRLAEAGGSIDALTRSAYEEEVAQEKRWAQQVNDLRTEVRKLEEEVQVSEHAVKLMALLLERDRKRIEAEIAAYAGKIASEEAGGIIGKKG